MVDETSEGDDNDEGVRGRRCGDDFDGLAHDFARARSFKYPSMSESRQFFCYLHFLLPLAIFWVVFFLHPNCYCHQYLAHIFSSSLRRLFGATFFSAQLPFFFTLVKC